MAMSNNIFMQPTSSSTLRSHHSLYMSDYLELVWPRETNLESIIYGKTGTTLYLP